MDKRATNHEKVQRNFFRFLEPLKKVKIKAERWMNYEPAVGKYLTMGPRCKAGIDCPCNKFKVFTRAFSSWRDDCGWEIWRFLFFVWFYMIFKFANFFKWFFNEIFVFAHFWCPFCWEFWVFFLNYEKSLYHMLIRFWI